MTNPEVTPKAADKAPKVQNPKAYDPEVLPKLESGEWDVVEIGGIDFAYVAAGNLQDVAAACKSNEAKGAQLYNRALRIDIPAKLDARERIKLARKNGTLQEVIAKIQDEVANFDVTTIATRAPRKSPEVTAENKATYSNEEVAAMCAAAGVKFTTR